MKHTWLCYDLLQALKGRTYDGYRFSAEGMLISLSLVPQCKSILSDQQRLVVYTMVMRNVAQVAAAQYLKLKEKKKRAVFQHEQF